MSRLKMGISMSLDGFVAGPDPSLDEPLGKGGRRCTSGCSRPTPGAAAREEGGEANPTPRSSRRRSPASARRSWAATCSAADRALGRRARGTAGGATIRPTTTRCSCSPITRASRWRCRAARRSTSSPTASSRRSAGAGRRRRQGRRIGGGAQRRTAVPERRPIGRAADRPGAGDPGRRREAARQRRPGRQAAAGRRDRRARRHAPDVHDALAAPGAVVRRGVPRRTALAPPSAARRRPRAWPCGSGRRGSGTCRRRRCRRSPSRSR